MPKDKDSKKSSGKTKKTSGKSSGTKLTKTMKKSGFMDLLNSHLGREILADALIAAAGAAAAALTKTRAGKAGAAATQPPDLAQTAAGAVAGVVTEAARHFLPASLVGEDSGAGAKAEPKKVKYVQRSSDHSKRKTTKAKSTKAATAQKH